MGFEVTLTPSRLGRERKWQNPFTGVAVNMAMPEMTPAELRAARNVLQKLAGGKLVGATVIGGALFYPLSRTGDIVKIVGELDQACGVLFAVASAGNLLIASDWNVYVTTKAALEAASASSKSLPILVHHPESLAVALSTECGTARKYTRKATKRSTK